VNDEDPESARIWVNGYVVRDPARIPSNWRSSMTMWILLAGHRFMVKQSLNIRSSGKHLSTLPE